VKNMPNIEKIKKGDFSEMKKLDNLGAEIALTVNLAFHALEAVIAKDDVVSNIRKAFDFMDDEKLILFYKIMTSSEKFKKCDPVFLLKHFEKDIHIIKKYKEIK